MNITEKAAYVKGLAEGLALDKKSPEGKLFNAIIDLLDDMALTVSDLEESVDSVADQIDLMDEDLAELHEQLDDEDEDEELDEDLYQVVCPSCGDEIYLTDSILEDGEMLCPNCGEKLEFDLEDDEACGCGCDQDHGEEQDD